MSDNSEFHIVIAGGGIGGLSAAMGLANIGYRVTVLEQAAAFGEIGAGIQIGPNAFHAMDYLGVGEKGRSRAVYIDELKMMDAHSGESVTTIPVGKEFRNLFGNPYAVIHRSDLHSVFAEACFAHPNVTMVTNQVVIGYEQQSGGVIVRTENGDSYTGDAAVGCDGVHSRIRQQITGGKANGDVLKLSGHVVYRSVLPLKEMPVDLRWNAATLWAGDKCHLVHYPLQGWRSFNIVAVFQTAVSELKVNEPGTQEEILHHFGAVDQKLLSILRTPRDWRSWVLADREPIENWTDGRVTLLGDAAHPTHQYFAQGACMAMEDSVCLTHLLKDAGGDFNRAFIAYQEQRMTRAYRVVLMSREIGKHIYHPSGMHRRIRNEIMGAKSPQQWYDSLSWLYGETGLTNAGNTV